VSDSFYDMILYYAMGGGLGHLTRSVAILRAAPALRGSVRLMASSRHAALVCAAAPCPLDIVEGDILTSRRRYAQFLTAYLERHAVTAIVLDTFPFGLVGEWLELGATLPRLLLARSLKWRAYARILPHIVGRWPERTLALEPLTREYERLLVAQSRLSTLDAPILFEDDANGIPATWQKTSDCLIVHSGGEAERELLRQAARRAFGATQPDGLFPERGIYPAEPILAQYAQLVSAAGYNMAAFASQAPPERTHLLYPMPRRFDNQYLRAERICDGYWSRQRHDGARQAAEWLQDGLGVPPIK